MTPQRAELSVQVVRLVVEHQPDIVACEFIDADDRRHTLIDKAPIFGLPMDADWIYPKPVAARCLVLSRYPDDLGRELVKISIADPDYLESTDGVSEFVVLATQVSG
jgi:hypothetical protein